MAQYRAGRVTVVTDSDVVAGIDTAWLGNVATGDIFLVRGEEILYRVAAVIDNTTLRINARYAGPTETNTTYSVTRDFTPNLDLPVIHNGDVDAVPLFAEALIMIDGKWGTAGGGGGGGGTGTTIGLGGLSDVTVVGAIAGDQFTKLPNGTYGFIRPTPFTISFDHAPGDGARIFKSYAGGIVTARRIKAAGGTVTENADDVTINIPSPGEVNTLESAGSAQSQSLTAAKSGSILRTKGLRAGPNITLTPEGNDLVIASTGGGGTVGGEANTGSNVGTGTIQLYRSKTGVSLDFRTVAVDSTYFTSTLSTDGSTYTLTGVPRPLGSLSNVSVAGAASGQFLRLDTDGAWKAAALPPAGIASVSADPAPVLGGDLNTNGKVITGIRGGYSGHIEKPKAKTYTLDLSSPANRRINSITAVVSAGSANFSVIVDDAVDENLSGTATVNALTLTPPTPVSFLIGSKVQLRINLVDALAADFAFSLAYQST